MGNTFAEEGKEYKVLALQGENPQGGRPSQNYKLSIDFAKKLCMISKSTKGEQARDYFVEVEKRLKSIVEKPMNLPSLPNDIGQPLKYAPSLLLWTDREANKHSKILCNAVLLVNYVDCHKSPVLNMIDFEY